MKNLRGWLAAAAAVFGMAAAGAASAQGYVGGGVGQSRAKFDCLGLACDKNDTGFKLFGGFNFNSWLGAELAYVDLGEASVFAAGPLGTATGIAEASGVAAYAVARAEDENWLVFARAGVASIKTDITVSATTGFFFGEDATETNFAWGLGIGWKASRRFTIALEYDRFRPEIQGEKSWVELTSVTLRYAF